MRRRSSAIVLGARAILKSVSAKLLHQAFHIKGRSSHRQLLFKNQAISRSFVGKDEVYQGDEGANGSVHGHSLF